MIYRIYCQFDCVVECEQQNLFVNEGETIVLDKPESAWIKVYPTKIFDDYYLLPYSFVLGQHQTTKFPQYTEIILQPKIVPKHYCYICSKVADSKIAKLSSYPHLFTIETPSGVMKYEIDQKLNSYQISYEDNMFKLMATTTSGKDYCCIYLCNKKLFKSFCANTILINKKQIVEEDLVDDFAKHALKRTYKIENDVFVLEQSELFYVKGEPKLATNENIIPIAFFEAIKIGDYELARQYLSLSLKLKLTPEHLQTFFGEFDRIVWHDKNTISLVHKTDVTTYDIVFENNEILNILEL